MRPPNGNGNGRNGGLLLNGRRRRARRRRGFKARRISFLGLVFLVLGGAVAVAAGAFGGAAAFRASCSIDSLQQIRVEQNSFVYAADGTFLGTIQAENNRQPVKLDEMSPWLGKATVAIEDRRFYVHDGLDFEGIARAAFTNVRRGEILQGGSTITQQLVRNLDTETGRERSLRRKLREACLALELDESWSKERILETYLNQVYYGNRAYGVEAAAQTYFSKPASELELPEAALLAGLPQAPSTYDPIQRGDQAARRRNDVLRAMRDAGMISQERYDVAVRTTLRLEPGNVYTKVKQRFFFDYVRETLIEKYGANIVRTGGLRVYTTINPRFQRLATRAIKETLNESTDPAAAIVSINPANGAIRAMVSVTPGVRDTQFNLAAQGHRQAGSAFKTFVLTEAIRRGINPDSTYYVSAPFFWQPDPLSEPWQVRTYDGSYYGSSSLTSATLRSDNSVYARLTLDLGPENIVRIARDMGINRSELEPVASIGLGSNAISVLEMASAYATLAAGGVYSEPTAIRRVVLPNGTIDSGAGWGEPNRRRVFSDAVAAQVTRILEQNVLAGTGTRAQIDRPAAGKTGTTDDHTDAWFCGYTPTLSSAVWVGYPNATIQMASVHGITVAGGTFPAEIWGKFMAPALAPRPPAEWRESVEEIVWRPWRGQYQYWGVVTDETETEETDTAPPKAAPTVQQPTALPTSTRSLEPTVPQPAAPPPPPSEPPPPPVTEPPPQPAAPAG